MPVPTITGTFRLGKDAEYHPEGNQRCNLFLIASDRSLDEGKWIDTRKFAIGGTVWGPLAEIAGNYNRGDEIYISGTIYDDEYQGVTRQKIAINAIGPGRARKTQNVPQDDPWNSGGPSDDVPF